MSEKWQQFLANLGDIHDLASSEAVLAWDQQTYMPAGGTETRAAQSATLQKLAHNLLVRDEMGKLLTELEQEMAGMPADSFEASLLRVTRRKYDRETRLPEQLVTDLAHTTTLAFEAWVKAKRSDDYALFQPHMERLLDLKLAVAEALGRSDKPYDALLEEYEPDLTAEQVEALFTQLRDRLVPLVAAIRENLGRVDDAPLRQHFPDAGQWQLGQRVLELMGFDLTRGRLDRSEHPFTIHFSSRDVRLTTNLRPNDLAAGLFSTMHEAGHGLYEQGVPWDLRRTPLAEGATLSVHESQSRLWENLVGRSRIFWQRFLPVVREIFPQQMASVNLEKVYQAVNKVEPALIRVDADEVTYNLHIFVRFELEQELITGKLAVRDLPDAWNAKYENYLGVTPPNNAQGVLQDVHWSSGLFGYFPTYALGNILSAQLWEVMLKEPGISDQISKGRFHAVKDWLNKSVHVHGAKFTTQELVQRVTGSPLTVQPYLNYIEHKYRELYGI